jgi:tRNA(Ile)-lysidine synthase
MALLHILAQKLPQFKLRVIVAHVNHKKREEAELDEALVKKTAEHYSFPYEVFYLPRNEESENFQHYARKERYAFFESVAFKYKADCIVTAHHADDHLETVIYRMLAQSTLYGLIGILPENNFENFKVIRPLIEVEKEQIYEYCHENHIDFREDNSNEDDFYTRNRIRHHVIPSLVNESPKVYRHIRAIADQLKEDEDFFAQEIDKLMSHVSQIENGFELSRNFLKELPRSLARRLIKRILQNFTYRDIGSIHIEEILDLVTNPKPNLRLTLPCQINCIFYYEMLQISTTNIYSKPYKYELTLNSKQTLPNGSTLIANYSKDIQKKENSCINKVHLCYNEIELPLKVRTRLAGDRISLRSGGTKKIKEIMIEEKIPKYLREQWPIITDAGDNIVWVPLLKKSPLCRNDVLTELITIEYIQHGGKEKDA